MSLRFHRKKKAKQTTNKLKDLDGTRESHQKNLKQSNDCEISEATKKISLFFLRRKQKMSLERKNFFWRAHSCSVSSSAE
jgi:hypothetical protein